MKKSEARTRDIGIDVPLPSKACSDKNCPFHGNLPVRGQIIEGRVSSTKMNKTAVVQREYLHYLKKYERYEKRTGKYRAHNPPCLDVEVGDRVRIMECRPLAKTVSYVIIERVE